ncbi:MAG: hypothetical protein WC441_04200 [Patescibacteria group bacterium]
MSLKKINLVAIDMGYGHQRAAYPLLDLAGGEILSMNDYPQMPAWERRYWQNNLALYEKISRFKKIPILGKIVFSIMDHFQRIKPFYPFRDLSKPSWQQLTFLRAIKKGLGKDLMDTLSSNGLPLVTTFFVAAYAADYHGYKGDVYCVVCDTDISRAWAPIWPKKSRTKFLVPSDRVKTRLLMYGVKQENIIVSGFPLPKENIGENKEILLKDLGQRLLRLDPRGEESSYYKNIPSLDLKAHTSNNSGITLTFAVGGAGAQAEIGAMIVNKLAKLLRQGDLRLNLVAGSRPEVKDFFSRAIQENDLTDCRNVKIIFAPSKLEYFQEFNKCLRTTDVLWTKPSELSFYCALGLPIIISEPVGSQEDFNREWLLSVGAGLDSLAVENIEEWWVDLLNSGRLARAAVDGFLNAESAGVYNIEKNLK